MQLSVSSLSSNEREKEKDASDDDAYESNRVSSCKMKDRKTWKPCNRQQKGTTKDKSTLILNIDRGLSGKKNAWIWNALIVVVPSQRGGSRLGRFVMIKP